MHLIQEHVIKFKAIFFSWEGASRILKENLLYETLPSSGLTAGGIFPAVGSDLFPRPLVIKNRGDLFLPFLSTVADSDIFLRFFFSRKKDAVCNNHLPQTIFSHFLHLFLHFGEKSSGPVFPLTLIHEFVFLFLHRRRLRSMRLLLSGRKYYPPTKEEKEKAFFSFPNWVPSGGRS